MENSLEALAKSKGAHYEVFGFARSKTPEASDEKSISSQPTPKPIPGFREEPSSWVGKDVFDPDAQQINPDPLTLSDAKPLRAPTEFSFFAGSVFLCITLLVLHTYSIDLTKVFIVEEAISKAEKVERTMRLTDITPPLAVFFLSSILACGYYISWIVGISVKTIRGLKLFFWRRGKA